MAGPWEKYAQPAGVPIAPGDPRRPFEVQRDQAEAQRAQAQAPYAGRLAAAQAAEAEARAAKAKLDLQQAQGNPTLLGNTSLTGGDYLKTLPPADQSIVRAMAEGRANLPSGFAMRSARGQQLLAEAAQYDPSFDAANLPSRIATRKQYTSGKQSQNIVSINTAIGHLGNLAQSIEGLNNFDGVPFVGNLLNAGRNAYLRTSGGPSAAPLNRFGIDQQAAVNEMERVFSGTGGTVSALKEWESHLGAAQSPSELRAAVQEGAKLLQSRLDALRSGYNAGMGTTDQELPILSQHAQSALSALQGDDYARHGYGHLPDDVAAMQHIAGNGAAGGPPPTIGGPPPGTPPTGGAPNSWSNNPNAPPGVGPASGPTRTDFDSATAGNTEALIRMGKSPDEVNAYLKSTGHLPLSDKTITGLQDYLQTHPDYSGFVRAYKDSPTTFMQRLSASPLGSLEVGAAQGETLNSLPKIAGAASYLTGNGYQQVRDAFDARSSLIEGAHPGFALAGQALGSAPIYGAAGRMAAGADATGVLAPRVIGADAGLGAVQGANADPNNPLAGGVAGLLGGGLGGIGGRALSIPLATAARSAAVLPRINALRGMFGASPVAPPAALSPAEQMVAAGAQKAGPDTIFSQLGDAQRLNVPMTLADTTQNLGSIAGAAVRRSPDAADYAASVLLPRSRGQVDRFGQAVENNLGPVGNIPQIGSDLTQQAKASAGPLYDAFYAAPARQSDKVDSLLQTPFGRAALNRAQVIAANEGRSPVGLGMDLDAQGNVTLTKTPTPQTLDYVKRGMDDVLEQYRNPLTGKLNLDEAGRAQNGVRSDFLNEMDRLYPEYAEARSAYAGPVQARDAMSFGQDALTANPDSLGLGMQSQPPHLIPQIQLGYRGAMMDAANRLRYSSNPFDAVLGTPAAEQRLGIVFSDNPTGVSNLLQTRDLEGGMARTTNDILGNSKTAQRAVADQGFGSDVPQLAMDAGINLLTGQVPTSLLLKKGAGTWLKDAYQMGVGKRAVQKADELASIVINPDPAASADSLSEILARAQNRQQFLNDWTSKFQRPAGGMFAGGSAYGFGSAQ